MPGSGSVARPRPLSLPAPRPLAAQVPCSAAGGLSVVRAPRLHTLRVPRHDDKIRAPATALGAAEAEILDRTIALPGVDDRLQVSRASVKAASPARHPQA